MSEQQPVEAFEAGKESPPRVKAFIQMRIERTLEDAALLTVEFARASERERFIAAAGQAFDRVRDQHEAYADAMTERKPLWRITRWIAGAIAAAVETTSALGQVAGKEPKTDSEIGDALPKGTP